MHAVISRSACDAHAEWGYVTTTNPMGAGKWKAEYSQYLKGRRVVIIPDNDEPGRKHAHDVANKLYGIAEAVFILELPGLPPKGDFTDWRNAGGTKEQFRKLLESPETMVRFKPSKTSPVGDKKPEDNRPQIPLTTDQHDVNAAVLKAISRDPDLYQRGGILSHVVSLDESEAEAGIEYTIGSQQIREFPKALIPETITRHCQLIQKSSNPNEPDTPKHPPGWCISAIHERGQYDGIRILDGITNTPVLNRKGQVLTSPGYDPTTRMIYRPAGKIPTIPDKPTRDDAVKACQVLNDLVCDFPYKSDAHRSAFLASLITPFARPAFRGCVPLFLYEANTRGSGKTLQADLV